MRIGTTGSVHLLQNEPVTVYKMRPQQVKITVHTQLKTLQTNVTTTRLYFLMFQTHLIIFRALLN